MNNNFYLGIDLGSTTIKAVILNETGQVHNTLYKRILSKPDIHNCKNTCMTCGKCGLGAINEEVHNFINNSELNIQNIKRTVVTGSQFNDQLSINIDINSHISEITAHIEAARFFYPECNAVLDVGGQDSKAMRFDSKMAIWKSLMSGVCASGTGAFLDNLAYRLGVDIEQINDLATLNSGLEFSWVCGVFGATSINRFKSQYPIGMIIDGACRSQARMIAVGVGQLFEGYSGKIIFQGGVAANRVVAHYLEKEIGQQIVIPKYYGVMGALGAAYYAYSKLHNTIKKNINTQKIKLKASAIRTNSTKQRYLGMKDKPLVWKNLFFPAEILNAFNVNSLCLEEYAALQTRNTRKRNYALKKAGIKGLNSETCSFLRILEGLKLPTPKAVISTVKPCQQADKVVMDLVQTYGLKEKYIALDIPAEDHRLESINRLAEELKQAVSRLEKILDQKMDPNLLSEACAYSNQARDWAIKVNNLRLSQPPLIKSKEAIRFASLFSQLWGTPELVIQQKQLFEDLSVRQKTQSIEIEDSLRICWLHFSPFYDNSLLDYLEEECSAPIIFEEVNYVGWQKLDANDPYKSLARKMLSSGWSSSEQRIEMICKHAILGKLDGVILYNHLFGHCPMSEPLFIKQLQEKLNSIQVPLLVLDGDCIDSTIDPCSSKTKIKAFTESLHMKKAISH
jgi:predicted CoA-substrate-specific enzyme activase